MPDLQINWVYWIPMTIGAVLLLIVTYQVTRKREGVADTQKAQVNDEDSALRTLLFSDKEALQRGIHICKSTIDFTGFRHDTEPYLEINFEIHDMSVLGLVIGQSISGYVLFHNQELRAPELRKPASIQHTFHRTLTIRQAVVADTAMRMVAEKTVALWLGDIKISVETTTPSGEAGPSDRLQIPNEVFGQVPEDLPDRPWQGAYLAS